MGDDILTVEKGESDLHSACKSGQVATVQSLCEGGAVLDLQDNKGYTALHVAASNGHLDVARVLVGKGANLCAAGRSGSTALHLAAKGGYLNIVQYLADCFAPIDMRNANKETALILAAAEGHENIVKVLIEQGAGICMRDIEGKTALDIAIEKGHDMITQLLKDRAEGRMLVCSNPHTDPQSESAGGNFENLKKAVTTEVSIDKATQKNVTGTADINKTRTEATVDFRNHRFALHTAAENGNIEKVVQLTKAGIAIDYGDTFGRTALWRAASRGHKFITRHLLENGSCVNIPDCEGISPINIAVREGHWDVVGGFLEHDPAIRPERTECLRRNLYEGSESGDPAVVRIIQTCGTSVNTTNKYGYTSLHEVTRKGQADNVREWMKNDVKVDGVDNDGWKPLDVAAQEGNEECVRFVMCGYGYVWVL
jgi:ankyrin repeat protein